MCVVVCVAMGPKRSKKSSSKWQPGGYCLRLSVPRDPPAIPPAGSSVCDWGLPESACEGLKELLGVEKLYPWQDSCLRTICSGTATSVIYSAPTSGGKSLVSDIAMFRRIFFSGHRALIVCPFISICRERGNFLRRWLSPLGIVVKEFHGSISDAWTESCDVCVCTVQKAISILHTKGARVGTLVVDEFHLVFQPGSGMESLISKWRMLGGEMLIGMSATLPSGGKEQLTRWLDPCVFYESDFRPISLSVYIKRGLKMTCGETCRMIDPIFPPSVDSDYFGSVCQQSLICGIPTIIFCATRNWCEKAALMLTNLHTSSQPKIVKKILHGRREMIEALRLLSPCGVHAILGVCILNGIAFHHAGLTSEERSVIELGFKNRIILILCATSTIAAGVNLPAARVILRTLSAASGGAPVSVASVSAKLKQMAGRAGRAGHSVTGEAIVFCQSDREEKIVCEVFSSNTPTSEQYSLEHLGEMKQHAKEVLETLVFNIVNDAHVSFFENSFSSFKLSTFDWKSVCAFLIGAKLVACVGDLLVPTSLGEALAYSAMNLDEAENTFKELSFAREHLCLAGGDLHLLFLVAPPVTVSDLEFDAYSESTNGSESLRKWTIPILGPAPCKLRLKKLMVALMMRDLIAGDLPTVARQYGVPSGTIQYIQSNSATYCSMVSLFCEKLIWTSLAAALNSVKPKLSFGVPTELVPLMQIEGISPGRARALAAGGYTSIEKVAHASPIELAIALTRDVSVEGTQMTTNETAKRLLNITCKSIIQNARAACALNESASTDLNDETHSGLLSTISPPLIHQLMTTQIQQSPIHVEGNIYSVDVAANATDIGSLVPSSGLSAVSSHLASSDIGSFVPSTAVDGFDAALHAASSDIDSFVPSTAVDGFGAVLHAASSDIGSFVPSSALTAVSHVSFVPGTAEDTRIDDAILAMYKSPVRHRRISEMTTIDVKRKRVDENEFGLPPNETFLLSNIDEDEIEFDSSLLRAIGD